MTAAVTLTNGVDRLIVFRTPNANDLRRGRHIQLDRVGRFSLATAYPDGFAYTSIDVGAAGDFATLLPFPVRNAADVIERYDEVVAFLERLPTSGIYVSEGATRRELRVYPE